MKLHTLQRRMFYYCQKVEHPALLCTMRSGKTILTIKDLIYQNYFPALICAPLSTLYGWEEDLQKIGIPKSEYQIITGTKKQKQKLIKSKSFIVTNKEFYISIPELIDKVHFKSVVFDESTFLKNHKANMTNFYHTNFRKLKRRYILTGSFMTGHEWDSYGQLKFLDPSIFPQRNFWEFRNKYFYESWKHNWKLKPEKKDEFYGKLNAKCCFVTLNDVRESIGKGELEVDRSVRSFEFSPKIKKIYDNLKKNFIVSLEDKPLFGFQYILQQSIYLRKLCSGFITLDPETKETQLVDDSKYKLLMDLINIEIPDYRCIILCSFYDEIYTIEKFFKQNKKKYVTLTGKSKNRNEIIGKFQKGKVQYLIANVGCVKHGVTLSNADITIDFSSLVGPETIEQAEIRGTDIYRDDKQSIIHLIAKRSVEEFFYKKIGKQETERKLREEFLKYLREN